MTVPLCGKFPIAFPTQQRSGAQETQEGLPKGLTRGDPYRKRVSSIWKAGDPVSTTDGADQRRLSLSGHERGSSRAGRGPLPSGQALLSLASLIIVFLHGDREITTRS
jgi:hypothetical protein